MSENTKFKLQVEVDFLREEVARLRERLEIDHWYQMIDGKLVKVPAKDGLPDGISCRDETIRMLREGQQERSKVLSMFCAIMKAWDAGRLDEISVITTANLDRLKAEWENEPADA